MATTASIILYRPPGGAPTRRPAKTARAAAGLVPPAVSVVAAIVSAQLGAAVAKFLFAALGLSVTRQAAVAIHEAFHVFQQQHHPTWAANEADLFAFPTDVPVLLALVRLEVSALVRALSSTSTWVGWALTAMRLRRERFAAMSAAAVAYERSTELVEGVAHYMELRALGRTSPLDAPGGFAADVRGRMYTTGAAMGFLLDRLAPPWRDALENGTVGSLDALIAVELSGRSERPEPISRSERARAVAAAEAAVAALVATRGERREAFLRQPGWQLIVVAASGAPLRPRGFDPMNVVVVGPGEVLHERYLALGNAAAEFELLDRSALTVAVGPHVLFDGVARLLVTGLERVPSVYVAEGRSRIEGLGCRGEFAAARIERSASTLVLRLAAS